MIIISTFLFVDLVYVAIYLWSDAKFSFERSPKWKNLKHAYFNHPEGYV